MTCFLLLLNNLSVFILSCVEYLLFFFFCRKNYAEVIRPYVDDTVYFLAEELKKGNKNIIVEGANAVMLDLDFGMYP